jgi:hypothetical protein
MAEQSFFYNFSLSEYTKDIFQSIISKKIWVQKYSIPS